VVESNLRSGSGLVAALACVWLTTSLSRPATITVDCDTGSTIGAKLGNAKPGDTLLVSGTCKENVVIPPELVRVIFDGQRKATIQHPGADAPSGPARHTVFIRGKGITITGFRITGGEDGIHLSGPAQAVIDGNVISHNRGRGVHLDKTSVAQLVNNTIVDNGGVGIHVTEQSYARIGFLIPPDKMVRPNTIQNNGGGGIQVERGSSAWIVANLIVDNNGAGIAVDRGSEADIVANSITGNRGDGIVVTHNSGVNLQSQGSPRGEGPNRTDSAVKNGGVGIKCLIGGYVDGPLGTLTGNRGAKQFDSTCIDRLTLH
jgi:parallel beta-helix repeat protein